MRYALLLTADESAAASAEERSERLRTFNGFIDDALDRGVLADRGLRLQPTSTATTVRVRNGDVVIADGPFAETKEQIGGLFVVECKNIDEAIAIATGIPTAGFGTIEVRPIWEM
jgi:hypothetical protein